MVERAAVQFLRTNGAVFWLPEDILKIPPRWEDAVMQRVSIIQGVEPKDDAVPPTPNAQGA